LKGIKETAKAANKIDVSLSSCRPAIQFLQINVDAVSAALPHGINKDFINT
jgi:hypothetical protein